MSIEAESLLVVFAIISIVVLIFFLSPKPQKRPKVTRIAGESIPLPFAAQVGERMSAAEMIPRLHLLRDSNAQWDAIFSELNPTDDPELQRLLTEIRGPHMFAPHVGISVIEDGCKRVLSVSPKADAVDALRQAIHSQEPFVR